MNIGKNNGKRGEVREKKEKLPKMQNSYCPPPPTGEKKMVKMWVRWANGTYMVPKTPYFDFYFTSLCL